jgi:rubrerythrin
MIQSAILASLAQQKSESHSSFWIVVVIALVVIGIIMGRAKVRCPVCGHQTRKRDIKQGRCPTCGSLEF